MEPLIRGSAIGDLFPAIEVNKEVNKDINIELAYLTMEIGVEMYILHELCISFNMILKAQFFEDIQEDCGQTSNHGPV
jgi:hypothetical protein